MQIKNYLKKFWAKLEFKFRLAHAGLKNGTVRFKITDLSGFYDFLNAEGIPYVVLRWAEDVPMSAQEELTNYHDVDHLIDHSHIRLIMKYAAMRPGKVKCDFYSSSGRSGTSYKGMPYYMPIHAMQILASRVLDKRGFYRPCPEDEFYAYAYHLCYHKGHRCGIPTGMKIPHELSPARNYLLGLVSMAESLNITLPESINLLKLHEFLVENGWGMSNDLMVRWPDPHPVLIEFMRREEIASKSDLDAAKRLTVFVLRDDCDLLELKKEAFKLISGRFTIVEEVDLDEEAQNRVMRMTRGGNWVEKYRAEPVKPIAAIICLNSEKAGPLPVPMSPGKLSRRYPHLENTDILIKRVIRERINQISPLPYHRVGVHATDNPLDSVETLKAVLGKDFRSFMEGLKD
jgi:hypothetical protein